MQANRTSIRDADLDPRKPGVVTVKRDPHAAGLDGQCREPGVRHEIAASIRLGAQTREDLPVRFAGLDGHAVRLFEYCLAEPKRLVEITWLPKHFRVGDDSNNATQNLWRHAVARIAIDDVLQPGVAQAVIRRVFP